MVPIQAKGLDDVKQELVAAFAELLERWEASASGLSTSSRELELAVAREGIVLLGCVLSFLFAVACRAMMMQDMGRRGLSRKNVRLRTDKQGYATIQTTLGPCTFPTFSYATVLQGRAGKYVSPGKEKLFPVHPKCRSSPLCLEWESLLAAEHPFRTSQQAIGFFSRGTVDIEDTTIADHAVTVGQMIDRHWLYKPVDEIVQILKTQATRDEQGRPIVYFATDAHALRRYVEDTWESGWKMSDGLRLWCRDAKTGQIIHLGGEYVWGGIEAAAKAVKHLIQEGILPNGSEAWQEANVHLMFLSDGSNAIRDHILPLLPAATTALDPNHVAGWFIELAAKAYPGKKGKRKSRELLEKAWRIMVGESPRMRKRAGKLRKGHTKTSHTRTQTAAPVDRMRAGGAIAKELLELLDQVRPQNKNGKEYHDVLKRRVAKNADRMHYDHYRSQGMDIGSGAMESLHRNGSQQRLKIPGARWQAHTSHAILQLRMLQLSGRWDQYWQQPDLMAQLQEVFQARSAKRKQDRAQWEMQRMAA
jgi:hypothetical protein